MARITTIQGFGDAVNSAMEQLLRSAVLETDFKLKQASPVDLGRFRLSWAIGENSAPFQGAPPGDYRGQPVPPPRAVNYALGQERLGNVYSIHNNLPYAEPLARGAAGSGKRKVKRYDPSRKVTTWGTPGGGSSVQTAGPGWVEGVAKDIQGFVQRTADRIARQS